MNLPFPGCLHFRKWEYHRPVGWYIARLLENGLCVTGYREIPAARKVTKAGPDDGDVTYRRTKHRTLAEKRMKERAGKEIPLFLIVRAEKK